MHVCIYCTCIFESAPGEHILQNFLGARQTSPELVCAECQRRFGQTIDSAFERGLRPIRNIFGTEGGRGEKGPTLKRLPTTGVELVDFEPGAQPRLNEPVVEVTPQQDGTYKISVQLGTIKQLGWAMKIIRERIPGYEPTESFLRSTAEPGRRKLQEYVKLNLRLGERDYFRGVLKACFNLFALHYRSAADDPGFDPVREFILHGGGHMPDFVRWAVSGAELTLPKLGVADQAAVLWTNGTSVEGVLQLFGDIAHPVRLSNSYRGPSISSCYIVDPFHETTPDSLMNTVFDSSALPIFDAQSPLNNAAVQQAMHTRLSRILMRHIDREVQQAEGRLY